MAKKKLRRDRLYLSDSSKRQEKAQLKKLTDHFGLPAHNGELLLNEIKLDNNPVNDKFRKAAKYLGLI